eukprot:TRINITY_DN43517_c0_g1_i3.p1 TRINITY_DN43517_c0_g1~~TRINITY_DN43517_c0_g1_i3.p1  ORF type:complete len:103 (+),score=17.16 TRINITY_DN43517_c0_g1_i3:170-478(+)
MCIRDSYYIGPLNNGEYWTSARRLHQATSCVDRLLRRRTRPTTNQGRPETCLLYTSDAADEEDSVDLGGRRIIKKKKKRKNKENCNNRKISREEKYICRSME